MRQIANRGSVLMIAYTNYQTDPRVIREAEAALSGGFDVDFIALRRDGDPPQELIRGIRHRIVNIQNDLRPHQLWQQCAENEEVGHVVHVYDAVAPLKLQPRGLNEASKEELKI